MKKFKFCILAGLLALLSVSAFAEGRLPANIQTAFQTLYPQATDVEWEQMAGCYVAEFIADGQEIDVWFNKQAEWVMTETDVESMANFEPFSHAISRGIIFPFASISTAT